MNTKKFIPDYRNIEKSAWNIEAPRLPLYEHNICIETWNRFWEPPLAD